MNPVLDLCMKFIAAVLVLWWTFCWMSLQERIVFFWFRFHQVHHLCTFKCYNERIWVQPFFFFFFSFFFFLQVPWMQQPDLLLMMLFIAWLWCWSSGCKLPVSISANTFHQCCLCTLKFLMKKVRKDPSFFFPSSSSSSSACFCNCHESSQSLVCLFVCNYQGVVLHEFFFLLISAAAKWFCVHLEIYDEDNGYPISSSSSSSSSCHLHEWNQTLVCSLAVLINLMKQSRPVTKKKS